MKTGNAEYELGALTLCQGMLDGRGDSGLSAMEQRNTKLMVIGHKQQALV